MALLGGCGTVAYLVVNVLHGCPLSEKYSDCARSSGLFDWWSVEPSYSGVVGFRLRRTIPRRGKVVCGRFKILAKQGIGSNLF